MHCNLLINFSCSYSPFLSPFTAIDISLSLSALVCIRLFIVYIVFFNSVFAMWMQLPDKQTMFFQCSTKLFPLTLFYINVIYLPLICHILMWRLLTYHIPSILIVFFNSQYYLPHPHTYSINSEEYKFFICIILLRKIRLINLSRVSKYSINT